MTLYLDASALLKRYIAEPGSSLVHTLLAGDQSWVAANHSYPEVVINLQRRLPSSSVEVAVAAFESDWSRVLVVRLDDRLCHRAAELGPPVGLQTLDAMHLAAAERAGGAELTVVTFDDRLAAGARAMGFPVAGV